MVVRRVAALLGLALWAAGCGGGGGTPVQLSGRAWKAVAIAAPSGADLPCPNSILITSTPVEQDFACDSDDTVTFQANGTFVSSGTASDAGTGEWSLSGSELTVTTHITDSDSGDVHTIVTVQTVTDASSGGVVRARLTNKRTTIDGTVNATTDGYSTLVEMVV